MSQVSEVVLIVPAGDAVTLEQINAVMRATQDEQEFGDLTGDVGHRLWGGNKGPGGNYYAAAFNYLHHAAFWRSLDDLPWTSPDYLGGLFSVAVLIREEWDDSLRLLFQADFGEEATRCEAMG